MTSPFSRLLALASRGGLGLSFPTLSQRCTNTAITNATTLPRRAAAAAAGGMSFSTSSIVRNRNQVPESASSLSHSGSQSQSQPQVSSEPVLSTTTTATATATDDGTNVPDGFGLFDSLGGDVGPEEDGIIDRLPTNYNNIPITMRTPISSADEIPSAPFRPGNKAVFLPWYIVSLMKSPTLPATWAKFQVPLRFGKLDLRDYLWHMYGVHAIRIRSFVKQSSPKLREAKRWFRPASSKYMVIQMDEPFYWPDDPTDFEPWKQELHKTMNESAEKNKAPSIHVSRVGRISVQNLAMLELQASKLRDGRLKWAPAPATFANPVFSRPARSGGRS